MNETFPWVAVAPAAHREMPRMPTDSSEGDRLTTALRWLRSHHRRLEIERRSAAGQLRQLSAEVERVEGEIARAEERLRDLGRGPSVGGPAGGGT